MKNVVGPHIRDARLRASRKVSQEELAARLQAMGVQLDQTAVSRIENKERQVTDVELLAICRALGIEVGSLFTDLDLPGES
jgi:transcriptional regulator with XRE-family HTH domain